MEQLLLVTAIENDELIHKALAIIGCHTPSALEHAIRKWHEKMKKLQNPTDNTGYMPLKRNIALTVSAKLLRLYIINTPYLNNEYKKEEIIHTDTSDFFSCCCQLYEV